MNPGFIQEVSKGLDGKRFDEAAAILFSITRSKAQTKIKDGSLTLNGEQSIPKREVKAGDKLVIISTEKDNKLKIPIVFEDKDIVVINKPSGVSAHPAEGEKKMTVTEILAEKTGEEYLIVHRLDKGTSGVMLLAKNLQTQRNLREQFKNRQVRKVYLALIEGRIQPEKGSIDIPLAREETVRNRIGAVEGGRTAVTGYEVEEYIKDYSYIEAYPKTGRTHQIRAHFASIGFPVVGDERYGKKSDIIGRIFLHAFRIKFIHPKEKKEVEYSCSLPPELERVLSILRD